MTFINASQISPLIHPSSHDIDLLVPHQIMMVSQEVKLGRTEWVIGEVHAYPRVINVLLFCSIIVLGDTQVEVEVLG